jgi:hypothetical protein
MAKPRQIVNSYDISPRRFEVVGVIGQCTEEIVSARCSAFVFLDDSTFMPISGLMVPRISRYIDQ